MPDRHVDGENITGNKKRRKRPYSLMASLQQSITRMLLGDLAQVSQPVRQRMLATVPTTPLSLAFYSFTLLMICGTTVYITGGQTWAWTLRHDGKVAAQGRSKTAGRSGSFEVERKTRNTAGADAFRFRAVNRASGEVCVARVSL